MVTRVCFLVRRGSPRPVRTARSPGPARPPAAVRRFGAGAAGAGASGGTPAPPVPQRVRRVRSARISEATMAGSSSAMKWPVETVRWRRSGAQARHSASAS